MPNRKQIWVSPNWDGWWRVHREWSQRDSAHATTKVDAMKKASDIAKNQWLELKIQNKDWKIAMGNSYGWDPFPPKDRK